MMIARQIARPLLRNFRLFSATASLAHEATAATPTKEFVLPPLPYPIENGLQPCISPAALDLHYNKHHALYVTKANTVLDQIQDENIDLVKTIFNSKRDPSRAFMFNNTAQIWNHDFFWKCMTPGGAEVPEDLQKRLNDDFGSLEKFKEEFSSKALNHFGSGWCWVVEDVDHASAFRKLKIVTTPNAGVPFVDGLHPLLTLDMWEHAFYYDYQNRKNEYVENFWQVVNWEFVNARLAME